MNKWNEFIKTNAGDGGILQSREWGEFQKSVGRHVECVELQVKNCKLQTVMIEYKLLPGLSYIYSPRGPVVDNKKILSEDWQEIIKEISRRFPHAAFWRIEPTDLKYPILRAKRDVQPSTTLIVELNKTEEELLVQMKQKTRYNIRLAEKHGVRVVSDQRAVISEQFLDLLAETAKRDGFRIHPKEYYRKLLNRHCEESSIDETTRQSIDRHASTAVGARDDGSCAHFELFCAFKESQLLAGAIVGFFGKWVYYLHGASSSNNRELMAPYLLHWEIMREAKKRGGEHYDFWGVALETRGIQLSGTDRELSKFRNVDMSSDRGHPWAGISKFKFGFSPDTPITNFPGTFDLVLKPQRYKIYKFIQKILRR